MKLLIVLRVEAGGIFVDISIVLLSWNRKSEIKECIDSIRRIFNGEIVVVDQNSVDGSKEYLKSRNDIILIELAENVGVAAGRNVGMISAKNDITIILDSDAYFDEEFPFNRIVEVFDNNSELSVIAFKILNSYSKELDNWPYLKPSSYSNSIFEAGRFHGCGHAIRKEHFVEVGKYDDALFFFWEEVDLSFRLLAKGYVINYMPEFVVYHSRVPTARFEWKNNRFFYKVKNRIYIVRKYYAKYHLIRELLFVIVGYFIIALRNSILKQWLKGIIDGFKMPANNYLDSVELKRLSERLHELEIKERSNYRNNMFIKMFQKLS